MGAPRVLILARGLGTRMRAADPGAELTDDQKKAAESGFKSLVPIGGRPFLDYVLSSLADAGLTDVGLVVAPGPNPLREHYQGVPTMRVSLSFVIQQEARGTADAVLAAERWAGGEPFVVVNADNLYPAVALRALTTLEGPGLPVFERDDLLKTSNIPPDRLKSFALLELDDAGMLKRIVEKPSAAQIPPPGQPMLVSMNCWRLDARIFPCCRDVPPSPRGELELPQAVMLALTRGVPFRAVPARGPVLDLSRRNDAAAIARHLAGAVVSL